MNIPADLKYTQGDEWIRVEGDEGVIGISDYAQDHLSDIVYVELPEVGRGVKAGESLGTIESVKAAADINTPVSGAVSAVNESLPDSPELVNQDPYGQAWMVRLKLSDPKELDNLMDAAAYQKYCEERG
ncbi:MAG TPA: glycine cleavage system protein GcvH [Anaerolineae bacterium]|nr:glycine cleavage system protein GcvH [Anaerolineae bacterium]